MTSDREELPDRDEWIARFVAYMVRRGGRTFDDGSSIEDYAREVAPTYWESPDQRLDGPEECASTDMDYWEEDADNA